MRVNAQLIASIEVKAAPAPATSTGADAASNSASV